MSQLLHPRALHEQQEQQMKEYNKTMRRQQPFSSISSWLCSALHFVFKEDHDPITIDTSLNKEYNTHVATCIEKSVWKMVPTWNGRLCTFSPLGLLVTYIEGRQTHKQTFLDTSFTLSKDLLAFTHHHPTHLHPFLRKTNALPPSDLLTLIRSYLTKCINPTSPSFSHIPLSQDVCAFVKLHIPVWMTYPSDWTCPGKTVTYVVQHPIRVFNEYSTKEYTDYIVDQLAIRWNRLAHAHTKEYQAIKNVVDLPSEVMDRVILPFLDTTWTGFDSGWSPPDLSICSYEDIHWELVMDSGHVLRPICTEHVFCYGWCLPIRLPIAWFYLQARQNDIVIYRGPRQNIQKHMKTSLNTYQTLLDALNTI